MKNQLKELNKNITQKNNKIKSTFKTMKKVKVYYEIQITNRETYAIEHVSSQLTQKQAVAAYNEACNTYATSIVQIVKIQSGGYVGGIILGGSAEIVQSNQ